MSEKEIRDPEYSKVVQELLKNWSDGSPDAFHQLFQQLYRELKQLARQHFRNEAKGHTLQTTALLHELYIRLVHRKNVVFRDRVQFLFFAGQVMRFILAEHARKRCALKRGGRQDHIPLDEGIELSEGRRLDLATVLALEEALTNLEEIDPRQTRIIELRFYAGLPQTEIAELLDVPLTTVKREWRMAKLWLNKALAKHGPVGEGTAG